MGAVGQLHTAGKASRKFIDAWYYRPTEVLRTQMKTSPNGLKPIPEKDMPKWARVASQAHRRATRKKRIELRQRGLPMIIWKNGKVREVPA
jgi:hypothetical protein